MAVIHYSRPTSKGIGHRLPIGQERIANQDMSASNTLGEDSRVALVVDGETEEYAGYWNPFSTSWMRAAFTAGRGEEQRSYRAFITVISGIG